MKRSIKVNRVALNRRPITVSTGQKKKKKTTKMGEKVTPHGWTTSVHPLHRIAIIKETKTTAMMMMMMMTTTAAATASAA